MAKVTNTSPGPRSFQVKSGKPTKDAQGNETQPVSTVFLGPGESADLDLVSEDDPVLKGMIENNEVVLGTGKAKLSDEEQQKRQERRFMTDPMVVSNREAAEAAGHTPGLADPLPDDIREKAEAKSEDKPRQAEPPARGAGQGPQHGGRR